MTLKDYLKSAKESIKNNNISQIVVGNESADLDSIISANILAFAYNSVGIENVVPLINCNKQDYKLRTESYGLLKRYNIDENDLIFIDDINNSIIAKPKDLKVTVVDHNKLPDNLRNWDNNVVSVFDHHQDVEMYKTAKPRIFESVGSCSTLVAQYILDNNADLFKNEEISILIVSPILVDTVNLDKEQGRVTDKDVEIFEKVKQFITLDVEKLYSDLQYMKSDVSALSSTDLLRKDYKQWASKITYGMASVPLSLNDWLNKDTNISESCEKYMQDNKLELLLVMTAYVTDGFKREMLIYADNETMFSDLVTLFNNSGLELTTYNKEIKSNKFIGVFNQGGLGFSRKKIQPLIEDFFK